MKATMRTVKWDEPKGCTTPRGWCYIDGLSITWDGQKPVGFYLMYDDGVFAKAYIYTDSGNGYTTVGDRCRSGFKTIAAAKRWIEQTARLIGLQMAIDGHGRVK
jgi:hypothetical protein